MLKDIGHPFATGEPVYDITFENVQAGLRTDYLFRLANHHGGIVIGTGDLSELALGWCTYGVGDQMAHYNVNAGVPKTLIQHLIRWIIGTETVRRRRRAGDAGRDSGHGNFARTGAGRREGETPQSTEAKIGPYALQDFTLFHIAALRLRAVEDRLHGAARLGGSDARRLAAAFSRRTARVGYDLRRSAIGWRCFSAVLRLQPVQAQRDAERPEGLGRRVAVAAWRLARAVGWQRRRVAGGAGAERSGGISAALYSPRSGRSAGRHDERGRRWRLIRDSFPVMVLAGLPPITANATSTVALFPGTIASTWAYRDDLRGVAGVGLNVLLPIGLAGGLVGAIMLLVTPGAAFDLVIPWLLLLATLTFAGGRRLGDWLRRYVRIGLPAFW